MIKAVISAELETESELPVKAVAVTEGKDSFFRKKTIGFDGVTRQCTKSKRISDLLTLSQSEKSIGRIVCGSISLQTPQITLSAGRAELRTTATAHILCEEENGEGRYFTTVKTLPVTIEMTDESISDGKQASATLFVTEREFTPELDQYGESRSIKTEFSVNAALSLCEQRAYTVAEDMFERDFDSIPITATAMLPHLRTQEENSFSVEAKLTPDEQRITDLLDCTAKTVSSEAIVKEDGIYTEGGFLVTLLVSTEQGVKSIDRLLQYSRLFPCELNERDCAVSVDILPIEVIPTLHADGSITARVAANAKISIRTETEERFISEVGKRTPREQEQEKSILVFCYPDKEESLWSIAKHYRTSPDEVQKSNPELFDERGLFTGVRRPILIKR